MNRCRIRGCVGERPSHPAELVLHDGLAHRPEEVRLLRSRRGRRTDAEQNDDAGAHLGAVVGAQSHQEPAADHGSCGDAVGPLDVDRRDDVVSVRRRPDRGDRPHHRSVRPDDGVLVSPSALARCAGNRRPGVRGAEPTPDHRPDEEQTCKRGVTGPSSNHGLPVVTILADAMGDPRLRRVPPGLQCARSWTSLSQRVRARPTSGPGARRRLRPRGTPPRPPRRVRSDRRPRRPPRPRAAR